LIRRHDLLKNTDNCHQNTDGIINQARAMVKPDIQWEFEAKEKEEINPN
jgi:hypothetical protein